MLVSAVTTARCLVAAEGALRAAGFYYPSFFVPDARLGSRLRAGMEGWSREEGNTYVLGFGHWNERGHAVAGRLLAGFLCAAI